MTLFPAHRARLRLSRRHAARCSFHAGQCNDKINPSTSTEALSMKPSTPSHETKRTVTPIGMPLTIWTLGFVSLLMDISSEMIHSLFPVFLVTALGTSVFVVGLIEGASEASRHRTDEGGDP